MLYIYFPNEKFIFSFKKLGLQLIILIIFLFMGLASLALHSVWFEEIKMLIQFKLNQNMFGLVQFLE